MKFLDDHRKNIIDLISKYDFDQKEFFYVKRKGRINVIHNKSNSHFGYLRKKETTIDDISKQWVDVTYYKVVKSDKKEVIIPSWELVLDGFKNWLKEIKEGE